VLVEEKFGSPISFCYRLVGTAMQYLYCIVFGIKVSRVERNRFIIVYNTISLLRYGWKISDFSLIL
jgi:hypothetical protein